MSKYSDGEFQPSYEESIRGLRVLLFTFPTADNLMEMLLMIDAANVLQQTHNSGNLILVGQDKIEKTKPDRAKLVANLLDAGATRVMTMDLHADQIQDS
jgi:ribose-phosphate pyrophosphokinase